MPPPAVRTVVDLPDMEPFDILSMIPYPERRLGHVSRAYEPYFGPCVPNITDEIRAKIQTMGPDLKKCAIRDMTAILQALGVPKAAMKDFDRHDKITVITELAVKKAFDGLLSKFVWHTPEGKEAREIAKEARIQVKRDKLKARDDEMFEAGRQSVLREYGLL